MESKKMIQPYSDEEYEDAKTKGYDLDNWDDYCRYFGLGDETEPLYWW